MGACLLRASEGACVRRLKAWLFLPDANLLPERGGTKPGESFSISTHAQPHVSRHTDSKTLATCGVFFVVVVFVTGDKLTKLKTANFCRLNARISGFLPALIQHIKHKLFCMLAFHGLTVAIATTSCGRTDGSCMNNSGYVLYFRRGLIGNCHSAGVACWGKLEYASWCVSTRQCPLID